MNKPIPSSAPPPEASAPERRWKVGTLTYTKGGLVVLFAWLLWGDFAWMIKERAAMPIAQLLLRQLQASDFFVGLAVGSVPAALAMVLGPIISVRSDRHRGRWGRRIPYLLVPTPFMVLGIVGLAFAPRLGVALDGWMGASSPGVHACRLIAFSFFWGLFEIFTTIANAVFNALIADVVPDVVAGRFFGMFRAIGLLSGIVFNLWGIGIAEQHMTAILIGVGLVYGIGFALMCLRVKEGEYPPAPVIPPDRSLNWWQPLRNYARECFTNPHYVWIFVAMMLGGVAGAPINSFGIFFAKSLNMSMETYGRLLVLTFSISFALSFLIGWLADRFHPLRVGMAAIGTYGVMMLWGGWAATDATRFGIAFVAHGVLMGAFMTGSWSISQRLYPKAKFAQFYSAAGLVNGLSYVIVPPLIGAFLDATGHVYRYTFYASGVLGLLGVLAFFVSYRRFLALGGDAHYVPPGDVPAAAQS